MKAFAGLILISIIVSVSIAASRTVAFYEPSIGVKNGDWIEYDIRMTGPLLEPLRNLTWYRIDILDVDGAWFQANKTALTINGTLSNSI